MTVLLMMMIVLTLQFSITSSSKADCPNQSWIQESLARVRIPGAAIAVVNATHTLYEAAFGYQSIRPKQMVTLDKSIFALASVSKTFVGVAVMQLVEQNLVDLDTDVNQYLLESHRRIFHPKYPDHAITLRRLLSHSASISVARQVLNSYYREGDEAFVESLADACFTQLDSNAPHWLPKPPGSVIFYSNEGSALAALVVERVTRMPYMDYVERNILKPLGVDTSRTGVRLSDFENMEDLVKHYAFAYDQSYLDVWKEKLPTFNITQISESLPTLLHIPYYGFSIYPAGLLRMSIRPLSLYVQMFINHGSSILRHQSIFELQNPVGNGSIPYYTENMTNDSVNNQESAVKVGLGWYWQKLTNGQSYIGHEGGMPGATNSILINEKNTLGVVLLSNGDTTPPTDRSRELSETLKNIQIALFECFDSNSA